MQWARPPAVMDAIVYVQGEKLPPFPETYSVMKGAFP